MEPPLRAATTRRAAMLPPTADIVPERRARRIARGLLVLFYAVAGVAHLALADAFVRIVPVWVPAPHAVVVATGIAELAGAAGLLLPRWRRAAGWGLALYAVCVFPANLHHAALDLGSGRGLPLWYHLPRLLLQPAIVAWALWASGALRPRRGGGRVRAS